MITQNKRKPKIIQQQYQSRIANRNKWNNCINQRLKRATKLVREEVKKIESSLWFDGRKNRLSGNSDENYFFPFIFLLDQNGEIPDNYYSRSLYSSTCNDIGSNGYLIEAWLTFPTIIIPHINKASLFLMLPTLRLAY